MFGGKHISVVVHMCVCGALWCFVVPGWCMWCLVVHVVHRNFPGAYRCLVVNIYFVVHVVHMCVYGELLCFVVHVALILIYVRYIRITLIVSIETCKELN